MTLSDFIEELEIAIKQDGHDIYCTADTAEMIKRHLLLNSQHFQQKERTNERNIKGALN